MIRALWILLVVLAVLMLWRSHRRGSGSLPHHRAPPPAPLTAPPKAMVRCAVCGVHLPQSDAIAAPAGNYCSDAHYREAQR